MDEKVECIECDGEGDVYIDTSRSCLSPMNECCGGCGYTAQCTECEGSGEVVL